MNFSNSGMINTLVIGGGGYIGSFLVPLLADTGRRVTVLGRSSTPRYELPASVKYISGDFSQYGLICNLLDNTQEVIHLAYPTVPNTTLKNSNIDLFNNLQSTVQLYAEVADRGIKFVLVSSGGTVYGEAEELPITELHRTKPISSYGVTKLTLENYAYLYSVTHGLKFICIRPSNAYGVGQQPFIGQGFIANAIASVMREDTIKIFGKDGTVRDYLYISDLTSGIVSALEKGCLYETYNLGSGVGLSNLEVVEKITPIMREIGYKIRIELLPERVSDVKTNILASDKLKIDTGWKPTMGFIEGIVETRNWLFKRLI